MAHLRLCNLDCGSTSASLTTPDMLRPPAVRLLSLRLRGKCKCSSGAEHFWVCTAQVFSDSPEALQLRLRQHLGQFDYARHVRVDMSLRGETVLVETAERRSGDM